MTRKLLLGASAVALTIGLSGVAQAQDADDNTIDISGTIEGTVGAVDLVGVDVDATADLDGVVNNIIDGVSEEIAGIDISGDNLSQTIGVQLTNALDNATGGATLVGAFNSGRVDGSLTMNATGANLSPLIEILANLDVEAAAGIGLDVDAIVSLVGGVLDASAEGETPDVDAVADLESAGIDVTALLSAGLGLGVGSNILAGLDLGDIVEGGELRTGDVDVTAIGPTADYHIAINEVTSASNEASNLSVNGPSFSFVEADFAGAYASNGVQEAGSVAAELDAADFTGGAISGAQEAAENAQGIQDDYFAVNVAFNNGIVDSAMDMNGISVRTGDMSTLALGASGSGTVSIGSNGAALNNALAKVERASQSAPTVE